MKDTIAAVVIIMNAENTLERCLASLSWCDEIIVVDSGSTDSTEKIARKYTDKFFYNRWKGYSEQKNFAVSLTNSEWIINLDSDERLSTSSSEEIKIAIKKQDINGYYFPMKTWYFGRCLKHGGFYPDYHLRLFRRNAGMFKSYFFNVHEGVAVKGKLEYLKSAIEHEAYTNLSQYFKKFNNYTTLEAEGYFKHGRIPYGYDLLIKPAQRFLKNYLLKLGFLDGIQGFLACSLASMYIFAVYLKLIELRNFNNTSFDLIGTILKR